MRVLLGILLCAGMAGPVGSQQRGGQFHYPGNFNWSFRRSYPEAAGLFNAFDYGHAVLYERLYVSPGAPASELEEGEFAFLTTDLLRRPPRFGVAEEAVAPAYSRLAWGAVQMFVWAHLLHRQIYDIYADERIAAATKDSLIERVTDYYLSNRRLAFTAVPKAMSLMDEQFFSQEFRQRFPKFNGLIWAYHWLQVGLYEPLIEEEDAAGRQEGVRQTVARFWVMIDSGPTRMPALMPMTATVAPKFSARHPRAAVIFDNLHMMHDIISDILASEKVKPAAKGATIRQALEEFRDPSKNVMTFEEWREMGEMMGGAGRMGGVAGRGGNSSLKKPPAATPHRHPPASGADQACGAASARNQRR